VCHSDRKKLIALNSETERW